MSGFHFVSQISPRKSDVIHCSLRKKYFCSSWGHFIGAYGIGQEFELLSAKSIQQWMNRKIFLSHHIYCIRVWLTYLVNAWIKWDRKNILASLVPTTFIVTLTWYLEKLNTRSLLFFRREFLDDWKKRLAEFSFLNSVQVFEHKVKWES